MPGGSAREFSATAGGCISGDKRTNDPLFREVLGKRVAVVTGNGAHSEGVGQIGHAVNELDRMTQQIKAPSSSRLAGRDQASRSPGSRRSYSFFTTA